MFLTAREVEESLGRGELAACLAWCHDNKSRLRKLKSSLEFQVRLQEFLELVKAGSKLEAANTSGPVRASPREATTRRSIHGHCTMAQPTRLSCCGNDACIDASPKIVTHPLSAVTGVHVP